MRDTVKRVAVAAGVARPLWRLRDRIHAATAPRSAPGPQLGTAAAPARPSPGSAAPADEAAEAAERRDRLDNQHTRLLLAFSLAVDAHCIDVGCHEGHILEEMVRIAPRGRHLAYEPIPHLHAALVERFPGVDVRRAALSDVAGETAFQHVRDLPGYSGLRERAYPRAVDIETITVRTERLDDSLPPGFTPAFIKIDVEGAERLVLEGAIRTIRTHRPTIVFEHGPGAADRYGTRPDDIHALLCGEAGLRIFDLDGGGPYSLERFRESFDRCERWNYVAHR